MRDTLSILLLLSCLLGGCTDTDCLPEPAADASPPGLEVSVAYQSPDGRSESIVQTLGGPAVTVEADANAPVEVRYTATDSSGLRAVYPSLLVQHTVGVGIERHFVSIDPLESPCPMPALSHREEVYGTGERRTLVITLSAENWLGERSLIEPFTVHLR